MTDDITEYTEEMVEIDIEDVMCVGERVERGKGREKEDRGRGKRERGRGKGEKIRKKRGGKG